MNMSGIFARIVAVIGAVALQWRRLQGSAPAPAWGNAPAIPEAKPQGAIPTLKMPSAQGWRDGQKPTAAPGLKVNAFAKELDHPRWINVLPNGDVLVAESTQIAGPPRSVFHYAMQATMRRAAALGVSADRITLLRDRDGDGVAEGRGAFMEGLSQPFGMALVGDTFYVGNTDGVVAFPYAAGADRITAPGRKLAGFKPGGHWTRNLIASPDGSKLYVTVGSNSNIGEKGMDKEEGRALIKQLIEHCTQPQYVFSVKWNVGDMVIWDNLCSMHRGGDYAYDTYKRDMRRTTVREGTEPHTMETGDDPFSELFAKTPKTVDILGARYAGR